MNVSITNLSEVTVETFNNIFTFPCSYLALWLFLVHCTNEELGRSLKTRLSVPSLSYLHLLGASVSEPHASESNCRFSCVYKLTVGGRYPSGFFTV